MSIDEDFFIEASELLESAEDAILQIESGGNINTIYNQVFRSFHSLKGAAGMMGQIELQNHMHLLEDFFQSYQDKKQGLSQQVDYFLLGIDVATEILKGNNVPFEYYDDSVESDVPEEAKDKTTTSTEVSKEDSSENDNTSPKVSNVKNNNNVKIFFLSGNLKARMHIKKCFEESAVIFESIESFFKAIEMYDIPLLVLDSEFECSRDSLQDIQYIEMDICDELDGQNLKKFITDTKRIAALVSRGNTLEKLLKKSISLLMYQFSDLSEYLKEKNRLDILETLKKEIEDLIIKSDRVRK